MIAALVPLLVLGVVGSVVQVPFVALGPGPTFDTLGQVGGKQVVDIQGAQLDPTSGHLNMTTVSVRDGLSIFEALGLWIDGRFGVVPRAEVYPPGVPRDQVDKSNQADFKESQDDAELAALNLLKLPTRLQVSTVADNGPAKGVLRQGDELVSVNGKPVASSKDVVDAVQAAAPSSSLPLVIRRDGGEQTLQVKLGARPEDSTKAYLGITPRQVPAGPMRVDFNLADIGGPSAGLMFSLAMVDKLTPGELNGGRFVAGTGTIDPQGKVGPIGGIQYKMMAARDAGAETFLVPAANCNEARQHTPQGLRLIKVENLTGAVQSLGDVNAGRSTPGCG